MMVAMMATTNKISPAIKMPDGESGWKWEKGGVGMGGKEAGPATQIKEGVGKDKTYQSPEYFGYDDMSFYDIEKSVVDQRVPQPKSGLTEYFGYDDMSFYDIEKSAV